MTEIEITKECSEEISGFRTTRDLKYHKIRMTALRLCDVKFFAIFMSFFLFSRSGIANIARIKSRKKRKEVLNHGKRSDQRYVFTWKCEKQS